MKRSPSWTTLLTRSAKTMARSAMKAASRNSRAALKTARSRTTKSVGPGDWLAGIAGGASGMRRFRLFRPHGLLPGQRAPLIVMLHGCQQDARSFATSTRMNLLAARERFLVLYPEQDRAFNAGGCWNWFDSKSGRAQVEAGLIIKAIDQVCQLYLADPHRVGVAGLSAGASMAALLGSTYPDRFKAVTMHSGIPPGAADSSLSAMRAMQGQRAPPSPSAATRSAALPPLMVIQGGADPVVSASNGEAAAHWWAEATGAMPSTVKTVQRGQRYPQRVTDFRRNGVTRARWVVIEQLGHAWSGGARNERFSDNNGPDASLMVWRFASKQFALAP